MRNRQNGKFEKYIIHCAHSASLLTLPFHSASRKVKIDKDIFHSAHSANLLTLPFHSAHSASLLTLPFHSQTAHSASLLTLPFRSAHSASLLNLPRPRYGADMVIWMAKSLTLFACRLTVLRTV